MPIAYTYTYIYINFNYAYIYINFDYAYWLNLLEKNCQKCQRPRLYLFSNIMKK